MEERRSEHRRGKHCRDPSLVRASIRDPVAYAAGLRGWEMEVLPSDGDRFEIQFEHLDLGPLRVFRQRTSVPIFFRGHAPEDEHTFALRATRWNPSWWNGRHSRRGHCDTVVAGTDNEGTQAAGAIAQGFCITSELLEEEHGDWIAALGSHIRFSPEHFRELTALVTDALDVAETDPIRAMSPGFRVALMRDARQRLIPALTDASPISLSPRSRARWRAVRKAERLALESIADPPEIAELCEAAGLRERALRDAFRSARGASPVRFLRALRLRAVWYTLRAAEPDSTTVTEVALDHGFYHLGRLSECYRRAYGELPSVTLKRPPNARLQL